MSQAWFPQSHHWFAQDLFETDHSISPDPGFLPCQKRMIHRLCLDSEVGWAVGSQPSGLCWHKRRLLDRLGGGQEARGKAAQS